MILNSHRIYATSSYLLFAALNQRRNRKKRKRKRKRKKSGIQNRFIEKTKKTN